MHHIYHFSSRVLSWLPVVCLSVRLSVCLSICKLFHIFIFSRTTVSVQTNLAQSIFWDSSLFKRKATLFFKTGDNYEILKIHWRNLKIFFSRTAEPISTQLSINHPWVKGIQVCSNQGPHPFRKGSITKKCKNTLTKFDFFFSRSAKPISNKIGTDHPWMMGNKVDQMKGHPF